MTHNKQNVLVHHAGDTHDLLITVQDSDGNIVDLTGATVEWYLKEDSHDMDTDAHLSKTGTEGAAPTGMTFNDPVNGEVTIHIQKGETSDIVDWPSYSSDEKNLYHVLRVEDSSGNMSTGFTGSFTLHVS